MRNELFHKTFNAEGAVTAHSIIAHGAADYGVKQATANTDRFLGLSTIIEKADGEQVDVIMKGIGEVTYGGNVATGDPITSDANGHAVVAAPGAGVQMRIVGYAMLSGVSGDIGSVDIQPGIITG